MKSMSLTTLCAVALVCGLAACDKSSSSSPTETTPTTATSATASAAAVPTPVTISDTDLVTPADMEPQAESTITSANYKAQLASLETEMSKE